MFPSDRVTRAPYLHVSSLEQEVGSAAGGEGAEPGFRMFLVLVVRRDFLFRDLRCPPTERRITSCLVRQTCRARRRHTRRHGGIITGSRSGTEMAAEPRLRLDCEMKGLSQPQIKGCCDPKEWDQSPAHRPASSRVVLAVHEVRQAHNPGWTSQQIQPSVQLGHRRRLNFNR